MINQQQYLVSYFSLENDFVMKINQHLVNLKSKDIHTGLHLLVQ